MRPEDSAPLLGAEDLRIVDSYRTALTYLLEFITELGKSLVPPIDPTPDDLPRWSMRMIVKSLLALILCHLLLAMPCVSQCWTSTTDMSTWAKPHPQGASIDPQSKLGKDIQKVIDKLCLCFPAACAGGGDPPPGSGGDPGQDDPQPPPEANMPADIAGWFAAGKICAETNKELTDEGDYKDAAAVTWKDEAGNFAGINIHEEGFPSTALALNTLVHEWMHAKKGLSDDKGQADAATGMFLCANDGCLNLGLGPMGQIFTSINQNIQKQGGTTCVSCPAAGINCPGLMCPDGMNCPEQAQDIAARHDALGRELLGSSLLNLSSFVGFGIKLTCVPSDPIYGSNLRVEVWGEDGQVVPLNYFIGMPGGSDERPTCLISWGQQDALVVTRDSATSTTHFYVFNAGDILSTSDDLLLPIVVDSGGVDLGTVIDGRRMVPNAFTDDVLIGLMADSGIWTFYPHSLVASRFALPRNLPGYADTYTIEMFVTYGNPNIPPITGQGGGFSVEGQPVQDWTLSIGISPRKPSLYPVYDMRVGMFSLVDVDGDLSGDVGVFYPGR